MNIDVTVVGAGHQGLTMAAHLSSCGCRVGLWNRSLKHIQEVMDTHTISCSGILNNEIKICKVSTDIQQVISKILLVATPSTAHSDIAVMLAPLVDEDTIIVLNPGRTFGALAFQRELIFAGCKKMPIIMETQTIIYTCRRDEGNHVFLYSLKRDVRIAVLGKKIEAFRRLPQPFRQHLQLTDDYLTVTLDNIGIVLHCAPVLLNVGWIENKHVDFKYYYAGITESIASFISKVDEEKVSVAKVSGTDIESTLHWLKRTYGVKGVTLYEALQNNIYYREIDAPHSIHHRYIEEDVPNGLVPLESMGDVLGVKTPYITLVINLACALMEKDYRKIGRKYMELIPYLK